MTLNKLDKHFLLKFPKENSFVALLTFRDPLKLKIGLQRQKFFQGKKLFSKSWIPFKYKKMKLR